MSTFQKWTLGILLVFVIGFAIFAIAGYVHLNKGVKTNFSWIHSDHGWDVKNARADSLGFAAVMSQLDARSKQSLLGQFIRDTNQQLVDAAVTAVHLAHAQDGSNSLWNKAVQKIYGIEIEIFMGSDYRTQELVNEMVSVLYGRYHGPQRIDAVQRVLDEFGYAEPESLHFTVTTIDEADSSKIIERVSWGRPFQYEIFKAILGAQLVDPLYDYLMQDLPRLQLMYQNCLANNYYVPADGAPSLFQDALVLFLEKALVDSDGIDFEAQLELRYGDLEFVNDEYEDSWSPLRKFFFRMGPNGTAEVRAITTGLLAKLKE